MVFPSATDDAATPPDLQTIADRILMLTSLAVAEHLLALRGTQAARLLALGEAGDAEAAAAEVPAAGLSITGK